MLLSSLILAVILVPSPQVANIEVADAGKALGADLSKGIRLQEATVGEVADGRVTVTMGSTHGLARGMTFRIEGIEPESFVTIERVEEASAKAKPALGAEVTDAWKGHKLIEAPNVVVAGAFDPIVPGYTDLSRDLSSGVYDSMKADARLSVGPLATVEAAAASYTADEVRSEEARKAIFDATGATIIVVGKIEKKPEAWTVSFEALDQPTGKVRATAERKLDPAKLAYYKPGAVLYDFKMLPDDDSRTVLTGRLGSGTWRGATGLIPQSTGALVVVANPVFGSDYDVSFHWNSNRIGPPNNPPDRMCTLLLHFRNLNNYDGIRFSGNEAFIVEVKDGKTRPGQKSVKLVYPNIDTDDGSKVEVSVVRQKVTLRAGEDSATKELDGKLPARVGWACKGESDVPQDTFFVRACTVRRGSGM